MEFVLERFNFDKTTGANLLTTFWVTGTVGRLVSVLIVRVMKPVFVFAVFLGILVSGEVVMLIAAYNSLRSLVWVSCGLYGLGMSALAGSIISWVSTKVCPMTGNIKLDLSGNVKLHVSNVHKLGVLCFQDPDTSSLVSPMSGNINLSVFKLRKTQ